MRKVLPTIILFILTLVAFAAAGLLFVEGSLARLTGWYHFRPGMSLFPRENLNELNQVSWIRIADLHDNIECERAEDGSWWIVSPFRDRMSAQAVQAILSFTANARLVDSLPLNNTTRASLREFGVETSPHAITLKMRTGKNDQSTVARFTLGSSSPWFAESEDGEKLLPTTYLRTDFYGRDKRIHVVSGNILSLFKNGLQGLRELCPLPIDPDSLLSLQIRHASSPSSAGNDNSPLIISRDSPQSPWTIHSPALCETDQDAIDSLISDLIKLKAIRIEEASSVQLPDKPDIELTLSTEDGQKRRFSLYPPFASPSDGQMICYATVSDRPVVFTLPVEPRMRRSGGYANIVNAVLSLPILPEDAQSRIRSALNTVYLKDIPMELDSLRSRHFSNLSAKDIDKLVLRSRYAPYPLMLRRIPGDSESQVDDVWMFSAEGRKFTEADAEAVSTLLNSLSSVPVSSFVYDIDPQEDAAEVIRRYGLNAPDYMLIVQPRECAARAVLFGEDMPLVRDRAPRIFVMKRHRDAQDSYWIGMEQNGLSIFRLSPKMMKLFSLSSLHWKKKNLIQFPISSLRSLTLSYQAAPLELHYDYIGEEWTGKLGDEDVSPRINPHRTNYYVRHLQNIRVKQWLSPDDEEALSALAKPVFSVKLELELVDYSDVEEIVLDHSQDVPQDTSSLRNEEEVRRMLTEKDQTDEAFRYIALGERKTQKRTVTIEIAPAPLDSDKPFFYGRIREDGSLFILSFDDAQGLDGQLLDR